MTRIYIYAAGAALVFAIAAGAWWGGKRVGYAERDAAAAQSLADWHRRETELLAQVNNAGESVKVIYRDKYKTIKQAAGDCLDRPIPANIVDSLR